MRKLRKGLVNRWFPSLIGILVVTVLAVVTGISLVGAHQGDSGTYGSDWIHACRHNSSGQIKYVGPNGTCNRNNETAFHWPATQSGGSLGPMGPQGPTGPQGEQGVQGEPGPAGPSGSTRVVGTAVSNPTNNPAAGTLLTATASCPAGKVLLGGGATISTTSSAQDANVALRSSYPSSTTEWTAVAIITANFTANSNASIQAFALCSL